METFFEEYKVDKLVSNQEEIDLARLAEMYIKKVEVLKGINETLKVIYKQTESERLIKELKKLCIKIKINNQDEKNWFALKVYVNQQHNNFIKKLKAFDTSLTESNLLLCCYIKIGKSNSEIAEYLNISPRSVIKKKYRLKKRWGLDTKNLTQFLEELCY